MADSPFLKSKYCLAKSVSTANSRLPYPFIPGADTFYVLLSFQVRYYMSKSLSSGSSSALSVIQIPAKLQQHQSCFLCFRGFEGGVHFSGEIAKFQISRQRHDMIPFLTGGKQRVCGAAAVGLKDFGGEFCRGGCFPGE